MNVPKMADSKKDSTAADPTIIKADGAPVDLSRSAFKQHLQDAAIVARDFTRAMVINRLPDSIYYVIHYGCSYDGNPLVGDEKTFPEDYDCSPVSTASADEVADRLWRDGFVPEWINVSVSHEDEHFTHIKLECCGRYSATPRMMYHVREGLPPFHVISPPLPPGYEPHGIAKFDLYWQKTFQPPK